MSELIRLQVKPGAYMESQSGLQRSNPSIYGRYEAASRPSKTAFVVVHPTSNFHNHYLIPPLTRLGFHVLALNTRYVGNDAMLLMERCIQDLGAGIGYLRRQGIEKIILIGNSGGGSLAALYQQQAEHLTIASTPDGLPFVLDKDDLPPVDALAFVAAHPGRATQLLEKIDGSVKDEGIDGATDPELDMFNPNNGPSFSEEWVKRYRAAQAARLRKIADWAEARLRAFPHGSIPADDAFVIRRTQADPRTVDLAIEPSARPVGTLGGDARAYNQSANGLARFCTLRSFLSQWSPWHSLAHGPSCLKTVAAPRTVISHTADQTVFPSHVRAWAEAAGSGSELFQLEGAPHYLESDSEHATQLSRYLADFAGTL